MNNNTDATSKKMTAKNFQFRNLHPKIFIGTASDRYAGWMDQIYTRDKYEERITKRSKKIGKTSFQEETLPVESVTEYFQHFPVLEIDYTFYSPLLDKDGQPAKNYHVLKTYAQYMTEKDRVILKVPQMVSAQKVYRGGKYIENETYLNAEIFKTQFYEPANEILGPCLAGMIFEQEYQRKKDRVPVEQMADDLDGFFESIPDDTRYHIELRTGAYLSSPVFEVLEKHGVGQVLSHWTWLPALSKQLAKAKGKVFNSGNQRIIRLMTPIGTRYEDAYAKAFPFDRLVDGMIQPAMIQDTVDIMRTAVSEGPEIFVLVNNRAGGNAPLITQKIAQEFLEGSAL